MTWSVTFHPALTGDVAGLAPSEKSALILDLLQLEQDGGRYFPGLPYPAVMPRADIWSYRFYTLPESGGVMALQGSWVDHDICVLGLSKQFATENAYDEWAELILSRRDRLRRKVDESLGLQRFLDIFEREEVAAGEQMILQQIRHRERRDMIGLAADLMRKESMALLNLNPARQQRLEHRLDFLLSQLQMHLVTVDCKVSLRFTFPDDHFDFAALKSLPGASGDG